MASCLSVYRANATLIEKDGTKPALPISRVFDRDFAASADIYWECMRDSQERRADPSLYLKE
jgi:hypothetical protein